MINIEYSGTVEKKEVREDGQHNITIDNKSPLFKSVNKDMHLSLKVKIDCLKTQTEISPWLHQTKDLLVN